MQINIVLYQPEIWTNTGNIIRTCFALKAKLHIIRPTSFDLSPKLLKRAAAGKFLSDIEHEIHENYDDFFQKYSQNKFLYYITRYGKRTYSDVDYRQKGGKVFLIFGRESTGIDKKILQDNLSHCLRIPMNKHARSLNLANCVALVSYEVSRQNSFDELSLEEVQKGADWLTS